jgi:hypothetical protein
MPVATKCLQRAGPVATCSAFVLNKASLRATRKRQKLVKVYLRGASRCFLNAPRGGYADELLAFCEPELRTGGVLAAHELNQLINAVLSRRALPMPMQWQATARITDFVRQHPLDTWPVPPLPCVPVRISEILPAIAPRAARGRADAGEAVGCTVVATTKLAQLTSEIPPPFPIQQHVLREGNQAVGQPHRLC